MKRNLSKRVFTWVLAAIGLLALAASAQAAERPYVARGTAQLNLATGEFVGAGTATYLGLYGEAGSAQLTPTGNPAVFQVTATNTYTAANGDQLRAVINGQLNAATGELSAAITYVGGTGRFTGASGVSILTGQFHPDGSMEVTVKGTIDY
jgi:hypothetical protein